MDEKHHGDHHKTIAELVAGEHHKYADHHGRRISKAEIVHEIDAIATAPGVTRESFAHIDEKKLLRKMDLRLIPMLTLLYLLSFIDRGNIGRCELDVFHDTLLIP